ncbi:MAG TPA: hypothetical protein VF329_01710 [Gammaproteobacteria bacterium]
MDAPKPIHIQLLGELRVVRGGAPAVLPRSRKTRGLLAFLAAHDRVRRREDLCELLWDVPNDPRAALRWSVSRLRTLLRAGDACGLRADRDTVSIDRELVAVDLPELRQRLATGLDEAGADALLELETQFEDGCLKGLDGLGSVQFQLWIETERAALRELHSKLLQRLVGDRSLPLVTRLRLAAKRVALEPLDDAANADYLAVVVEKVGLNEARQAFEKVRARYRAEKQPERDLLLAWHRLTRGSPPPDHQGVGSQGQRNAARAGANRPNARRSLLDHGLHAAQ